MLSTTEVSQTQNLARSILGVFAGLVVGGIGSYLWRIAPETVQSRRAIIAVIAVCVGFVIQKIASRPSVLLGLAGGAISVGSMLVAKYWIVRDAIVHNADRQGLKLTSYPISNIIHIMNIWDWVFVLFGFGLAFWVVANSLFKRSE